MEELLFGRRYRATEKIGTGGMADVYKAVDEVLGRTVAVKVMHARFAADPAFAARFRQEAQAAANLVSPNIVNMYDWGQDGDTYYIVMEYVRGSDLKSIIVQKGALPSRKVAEIGAQVCSALSVAHGYDIIHRDIKPHNIMVQPDGTVKVMDFGIARAGNSTMTQTGSVLGTAQYVSPEQAQGKPLNAASDLYSLGVVLYEAATGRLPFDADTPVAVALKQVNEQAIPPHVVNPEVDPSLDAVIVKAMQKKTADRYVSADDLKRDLRAVAAGRPIDAATQYPGAPAGAAAGGMAARMDETAVMPRVGGSDNDKYGNHQQQTHTSPRRRPVWPWILLAMLLLAAGLGVAWNAHLIGPAKSTPIPDVSAMTRVQAQTAIQDAGFVLGTVKEAFSDTIKSGIVISQLPDPNVPALKGAAVNLVLSKGPDLIRVPKVNGMLEADAYSTLRKAGFSPQALPSEFNKDVPANTVYNETPDGGKKAVKGSVVTYIVSRGAELVVVPDVTGKKQSTASSTLSDAGFNVATQSDNSDKVHVGLVISQNPPGAVSVTKGSTVTITISKGPAAPTTAAVPFVINKDEKAARDALLAAGFQVTVIYEVHTSTGLVFDQSPTASSPPVKLGSTVTIKVDSPPMP